MLKELTDYIATPCLPQFRRLGYLKEAVSIMARYRRCRKAWQPHLEVVYHLWSVPNKNSLVLKVMLPRWKDDQQGELPEVPSVAGVWSTADWHEREVYDLCGVRFTGHPNPRRILCPEDWVGHPLRKDYEMPLEYHGIRGK